MGAGKSSAMINYINNSNNDIRFIYVTPYLTEVERIIGSCPSKKFEQPFKDEGFKYSKLRSLKILLGEKRNVVTTHALFHYFDDEVIGLISSGNYVLILDEVADVVTPYLKENTSKGHEGITRSDLNAVIGSYATVDEDSGFLKWTDKDYNGKLNEYKILCDLDSLAVYSKERYPLWLFPIKIFRAFKDVFVLTYMFNAQIQRYYYDLYGVEYDYWGVTRTNNIHTLTQAENNTSTTDYRKLIHICNHKKLNQIGDRKTDLSKGWYMKNKNSPVMTQLRNNTSNYFKNVCGGKSSSCIWTTFKSYRKNLQGKGYTKGFITCNMRATNEYRDRNRVAYLMNRYMNPIIKNFFLIHGVSVNEDEYSLSEMLQFLFRTAIRNGEEIWIYIPSRRMRSLLEQWIDENSPKIT